MYYLIMAEDPGVEHQEEREMSDAELAQAYLSRELAETNKRLSEVAHSERFYSTYKGPTHPGGSPHSDAGMDISDWNVARLEYEQWPEEQEEMLDHLDAEREALEDRNSDLHDLRERMESGDPFAIALAAGRERARLAAIKERQKVEQEKKDGVVFEGTDQVVDEIAEFKKLVVEGAYKNRPNGWGEAFSYQHGREYQHKSDDNPLGLYDAAISIRKPESWESPKPGVDIVRFRNLSGVEKPGDKGLGLYFEIGQDKRVKDHFAYHITPEYQFRDHGPLEVKSTGENVKVNQEVFNKFHSAMTSLVEAGRAGLSQPQS